MIPNRLKKSLLDRHGENGMIKKSFQLAEGFALGRIPEEIQNAFNDGTELTTVAIFSDLAGFSQRITGWPGRKINSLLNRYYNIAIPAIYQSQGEIEKLIGDGIVAIFGPPFKNLESGILSAIIAGSKIIRSGLEKDLKTKVALRIGSGFFTYVGNQDYTEATLVGPLLTEVFRLEEVAKPDSISVYAGTNECKIMDAITNYINEQRQSRYKIKPSYEEINLRGVSFRRVKHFTHFKAD
ncbi:adenylate/guanylate cyclase domain-containing protein [Archangium violaceum]|uniref:adenylate/guanylate cyclase domain-containing protein n=1 Tax=Archangium violaceum TaxID=83451 RepID=UPI0036DF2481